MNDTEGVVIVMVPVPAVPSAKMKMSRYPVALTYCIVKLLPIAALDEVPSDPTVVVAVTDSSTYGVVSPSAFFKVTRIIAFEVDEAVAATETVESPPGVGAAYVVAAEDRTAVDNEASGVESGAAITMLTSTLLASAVCNAPEALSGVTVTVYT